MQVSSASISLLPVVTYHIIKWYTFKLNEKPVKASLANTTFTQNQRDRVCNRGYSKNTIRSLVWSMSLDNLALIREQINDGDLFSSTAGKQFPSVDFCPSHLVPGRNPLRFSANN